ncbi:MAG: NAD(P)H-hydrate dehydratase [Bacillota bacterium]|jgi:hydroxyethylthiazole kinase-like uncharacterized protein yjeF|nr:NAD(P)H-hydrate dehydratase [Bacillota bacterium]
MKLANPDQMKRIDQLAIDKYKIPGIVLMETAAQRVAEKAMEMLGEDFLNKKTVVIAGKGNNGGDAFAAARHLHQWGCPVTVISLAPVEQIRGEPEIYIGILEQLGVSVHYLYHENDLPVLEKLTGGAYLVIDGIFGTGIYGDISGFTAKAITAVNNSTAKVLSIDIPSGINGRTGQVCKLAVKADETVTFALPKPGLFQYPGAKYAGNISIADIGIPPDAVNKVNPDGQLIDCSIVLKHLPKRPADGHKGTFGKLMIISGSAGMSGSGTLAARAAFKTGSGLVYLAVPKSLAFIYNVAIPEAITIQMQDDDGIIMPENLEALKFLSNTMDAVVIGPGLSTKPQVSRWVGSFVAECNKPIVIDADALNIIARQPHILLERKAPTVITPHPGEFSRLTGLPVEDVQKNRIDEALSFSSKYNVTVVLKGAGTVIANPGGEYFINATGHPGMAVAGSGDVLAGIIGSLIGQGVNHEKACAVGVFIHGKCGEMLARLNSGQSGFLAGELCGLIPKVVAEIVKDAQAYAEYGRWICF